MRFRSCGVTRFGRGFHQEADLELLNLIDRPANRVRLVAVARICRHTAAINTLKDMSFYQILSQTYSRVKHESDPMVVIISR